MGDSCWRLSDPGVEIFPTLPINVPDTMNNSFRLLSEVVSDHVEQFRKLSFATNQFTRSIN